MAGCDSILYKEALKTIAPSLTQKLTETTKSAARRSTIINFYSFTHLLIFQNLNSSLIAQDQDCRFALEFPSIVRDSLNPHADLLRELKHKRKHFITLI